VLLLSAPQPFTLFSFNISACGFVLVGLKIIIIIIITKHIISHIGDEFYGSSDPTNCVKALKTLLESEPVKLVKSSINQTHITRLC